MGREHESAIGQDESNERDVLHRHAVFHILDRRATGKPVFYSEQLSLDQGIVYYDDDLTREARDFADTEIDIREFARASQEEGRLRAYIYLDSAGLHVQTGTDREEMAYLKHDTSQQWLQMQDHEKGVAVWGAVGESLEAVEEFIMQRLGEREAEHQDQKS